MGLDLAHVKAWADRIREQTDDPETFLDTLEGQTDALEVLRRCVLARAEAAAQEAATKELEAIYFARSRRLAEKQDSLSQFIGEILDAIGETKVQLDVATVSRISAKTKVGIIDEDQIPTQLTKVTYKPDLVAIKAQLEAGEIVPGAELVQGNKSINVRIK
jgi:hypothetical protein